MNLPFFIARRYLFSKKRSNAINVITWVSVLGIAVGTAAMILTLSIFNGLGQLLGELFDAMDPHIRIEAAEGKTLPDSAALRRQLAEQPGVASVTRTIEDRAYMEYFDKRALPTLKGVEPDFARVNPIAERAYLYDGVYTFDSLGRVPQAVFGAGVAYQLSINLSDRSNPVEVKVLNESAAASGNLSEAINYGALFPAGVFSVQKEYDEKFVLVDLETARRLLGFENRISAYELNMIKASDADAMRATLEQKLGPAYRVLGWREQHASLWKVMRTEKRAGYLILTLLVAIAAINIIGALSMIVLEKTRDIAVLRAAGASRAMIRNTFLLQGLMTGGIGAGAGMLAAYVLGFLQEKYGILSLGEGSESFRINAFPIQMWAQDFVLIGATVLILAVLAALYPAWQASRIGVVEGMRR